MAWYYVKRSCGHEERFQITGNHSYREWMISRLEKEPCADCVAAERAEGNAAAAAANAESELPALVGSEKQIGWAETIRKGKLDQLPEIQRNFADEIAKAPDLFDATMRTIHSQNSASWWIDHRDMGLEYIIEEVGKKIRTGKVVPPTVPDVPVDAIAESTLRPENPKTETVAEIAIRESTIHITFPEKRESFRELMYDCGFRWNDGHWTRTIGKFAGAVEDRAAEVTAKAIAARYIVRAFDESIQEARELYRYVTFYNSSYYHKAQNMCYVIRGSQKRRTLPIDYMDEEDIIAWICEHEEYSCIADPCIGRGLVAVGATKNGRAFVGTELNHKRLSVLIERVGALGLAYTMEPAA